MSDHQIFDIIPSRDADRLAEFIRQNPGSLRCRDLNGARPAHWAAYYGVGINDPSVAYDNHCNTPGHYSALSGRDPGTKPDKNNYGYTPQQVFNAVSVDEKRKMMFRDPQTAECSV